MSGAQAAPAASERRDRPRRGGRVGATLVALFGLGLLASALMQPAKSALGGALLDDAFDARRAAAVDARADAAAWRPWPWAQIAPIGRVTFPRLGESRIVLDSVSGEALAWGVGHAPETAALGAAGATAIAGHRDGAFALLGALQEGDVIELTPLDGPTLRYQVVAFEVVDSRHEGFPLVRHGPDTLLLATCWPIEALVSGPERLLVTARRID